MVKSSVGIGEGLSTFPTLKQIESGDGGVRDCMLMEVVEVEVP